MEDDGPSVGCLMYRVISLTPLAEGHLYAARGATLIDRGLRPSPFTQPPNCIFLRVQEIKFGRVAPASALDPQSPARGVKPLAS